MKSDAFIALLAVISILVPSFVLISFSQSNETLSDDALFDEPLSDGKSSNESSFSIFSREFAENQTDSDVESSEDEK